MRLDLDGRFSAIDRRFATIDRRFNAIEQRFTSVDQKFMWVIGLIVGTWIATILTILFHR